MTPLKKLEQFYEYCELQDPLLVVLREHVPEFNPETHRLMIPTGAFPANQPRPLYVAESSALKNEMIVVGLDDVFANREPRVLKITN